VKHIPENIQVLVQRYFEGTISPEEKKLLDDWYRSFSADTIEVSSNESEEQVRLRLQQRLESFVSDSRRIRPLNKRFLFRAAAIFVILLSSAAFYFLFSSKTEQEKTAVAATTSKDEIVPGGNKAILTLSDGSSIMLDNAGNGDLGQQGNSKIIKTADGLLEYHDKDLNAASEKMLYNIVSTPRGGQYRIELADGTSVWLNASSSIRFPVAFEDSSREVEVTGEVYFEVAKNPAKPFKVKVKDTYINVLGTHFNINAYDNEEAINTTLLEGSLQVVNNKLSKLLKPGETAVTNPSGITAISKDDSPEDAIAWVKGKFLFHSADIHNIMRQVERWYDVEVNFEKAINLHFTGELKRSDNVMTLLRKLELTGEIHFKIDKKKITVLP
jgi:transmembrane sensor